MFLEGIFSFLMFLKLFSGLLVNIGNFRSISKYINTFVFCKCDKNNLNYDI